MKLAKFRKRPEDVKRYVVDYTDWLDADELVTTVTMQGNVEVDAFYIEGYVVEPSGKSTVFFVSGGMTMTDYDLSITVTTNKGQVKKDVIQITVV